MIATIPNPAVSGPTRELESTEVAGLTELVRGCDRRLVDHLTPHVRRGSIALDFHSVERIDAAGIAALITLYADARQAGHHFSIFNVAPRVVQILAIVGLDRILVSRIAPCEETVETCFDRSAA
ncbi:MAG: STAS domain-containing protein [Terracidiphilus sp.]|jgi:anti-anti-sigma factor